MDVITGTKYGELPRHPGESGSIAKDVAIVDKVMLVPK